jgi:hypothetical protein
MAYKVVCTKCGKPIKVQVYLDGKRWQLGCKCTSTSLDCADQTIATWKIEASGKISEEEALKYCVGCYENIYNGNNNVGVEECWNLKTAKLVMKKKVGIDDVPPWNHVPIKCLSCYHETGYVMVDAKATY